MEISSEIHNVIINLQKKKNELSDKIEKDITKKDDLEKKNIEILADIQKLDSTITIQKQKINEISSTIEETEKGYNKIIEAGETLMAIIRQNNKLLL